MALFVSSCTSDEIYTPSLWRPVPAHVAMNVSTSRASTRMTAQATQQDKNDYRGIRDINLMPFSTPVIGADATLPQVLNLDGELYRYESTLNYYDSNTLDIPIGTRSFLCYARANALAVGGKFENGSLIVSIPDAAGTKTGNISISPEVIHDSNVAETTHSNIAEYLTAIAAAVKGTEGKEALYRLLTNGSVAPDAKNHTHLLACASTNVAQLAAWVENQGVTLPAFNTTDKPITGYPAQINLPDGAAVVQWDNTQEKFVPQTATTTEANINSLNRFVYPAELYYYASSLIYTSYSLQKDYYNLPWDGYELGTVLNKHENKDATIMGGEVSIAIKDPLSYAVGCLQVGLNVQSTLEDAAGETITLASGATFPLTAILVSSQFAQGYDFTPTGAKEHIIYDKTIEGGIAMGSSIVSTPTTPSIYTNTLVLQTKDNENVRFALEFENNSGQSFEGINGTVFPGTKFYLVGTIEVPVEQDQDYKRRVFTKDYITKGVVKISSLKEAYTYLPDLLDPRLEVAIRLVPDWIQVTTTNVPL